MDANDIALLLILLLFGAAGGATALWAYHKIKLGGYSAIAAEIVSKANLEADSIKRGNEIALKQTQLEQQREMENIWQQERKKLAREEDRLKQREDKLETRMNAVEKKILDLEKREGSLTANRAQLDEEKKQVYDLREKLLVDLERIGGLSSNEARDQLLEKLTNDVRTEAAHLSRRIIKEAEENADDTAKKIIITSINRLAVPTVSEGTLTTVPLPSEEMKGRIIGREGRNIRALERATGVNFIIDDTPGAVVLSGFDPLRLHVAKQAITELMADGRIHPTRIEEIVEKAHQDVIRRLKQHGEDAALRAGAINLHPELIMLLGKLKLRFSYGQNVLDHSLEVSHLMGLMAAELGLDIKLAKRIGLLHDIGKAVSHEVEGSHAVIGHDLALKYGESIDVATGIGCHHGEMTPTSPEGSFCQAADAISGSRPGGRMENAEEYVKRLKKLEDLAYTFPGVEKAFALQAGREIRVAVLPEKIDDDGVINLARELTRRIENELTYPGKIKVTVTRERRATEYAV